MNAHDQSVYPAEARQSPRIIQMRSVRDASSNRPESLICPCAEGWHVIPFSDISHCVAEGNYVQIHYGHAQSIMASKTLLAVEKCLPGSRFVKSHQSYLVAIDRIRMLGREELVLASGQKIPVSRARRNALKEAVLQHGVKLG